MNRHPLLAAALIPIAATVASASDAATFDPQLSAHARTPLALPVAAAYAADPDSRTDDPPASSVPFGDPGRWWLTIGAGIANDFGEETDYNLHLAASTFLGKDLEFSIELAGWYFAQDGDDTGGFNPNMVFRWHFWHDEAYTWTVYADAGIGLLFAFDDVPAGGTSFNFTPRVGAGATFRLSGDTRLQVGLRYHHISNGRVQGDDQNPSRDSLMFYLGVVFPL